MGYCSILSTKHLDQHPSLFKKQLFNKLKMYQTTLCEIQTKMYMNTSGLAGVKSCISCALVHVLITVTKYRTTAPGRRSLFELTAPVYHPSQGGSHGSRNVRQWVTLHPHSGTRERTQLTFVSVFSLGSLAPGWRDLHLVQDISPQLTQSTISPIDRPKGLSPR